MEEIYKFIWECCCIPLGEYKEVPSKFLPYPSRNNLLEDEDWDMLEEIQMIVRTGNLFWNKINLLNTREEPFLPRNEALVLINIDKSYNENNG